MAQSTTSTTDSRRSKSLAAENDLKRRQMPNVNKDSFTLYLEVRLTSQNAWIHSLRNNRERVRLCRLWNGLCVLLELCCISNMAQCTMGKLQCLKLWPARTKSKTENPGFVHSPLPCKDSRTVSEVIVIVIHN